tara:strand:+ start:112 stop:336 length:225 start_codon:yes stop_codon:yes gene_type:complete
MTDEEFQEFAAVAMAYGVNQLSPKQWAGLTDEQIIDIADDYQCQHPYGGMTFDGFDVDGFVRAIEAKLKEKNYD